MIFLGVNDISIRHLWDMDWGSFHYKQVAVFYDPSLNTILHLFAHPLEYSHALKYEQVKQFKYCDKIILSAIGVDFN